MSLLRAVDSNDHEALLVAMHDVLASGVKWTALSDTMKSYEIPIELLFSCIELLVSQSDSSHMGNGGSSSGRLNISAAHLLIELAAGRDHCELQACQSRAATLFEGLISAADSRALQHARLSPKIAATFSLELTMVKDKGVLIDFVRRLLEARATFSPALSLLDTFPSLNNEFDKGKILTSLIEAGQEEASIKWAANQGENTRILLVEILVANDRWKAASFAVKSFGLRTVFPDVEGQYVNNTVVKMIGKRLWSHAIEFCGPDARLQAMVLQAMVEEGEITSAEEFRRLLSLPATVLSIDADAIQAEHERRAKMYLQLDSYLSPTDLVWVDSATSLHHARVALSRSAGHVGIDVEWKPVQIGGGGRECRASILQLATEKEVFIFDLITLTSEHSEELDRVLSPLMTDWERKKLGFEISSDFKVLRSSYPALNCFRRVCGIMDLKHLWFKYLEESGGGRAKHSSGLSTLCQTLLGKPLDKSQQVSDWETRPLRARQLDYAALDSLSLILLFKKFEELLSPGVMDRVIASSSFDSEGILESKEHDDDDRPGPGPSKSDDPSDLAMTNDVDGSSSTPPDLPPIIRVCIEKLGLGASHVVWKERGAGRSLISAEDAARTLGVDTDWIVKSMALWVRSADHCQAKGSTGLVAALRGSKRIDLYKVAKAIGVNRRQLSFASKEDCLARFGYASGSLPPFGFHLQHIKVLLDNGFRKHSGGSDILQLYCGVGIMNASLGPISLNQLLSLSDGVEADVAIDPDGEDLAPSPHLDNGDLEEDSREQVKLLCDSMLGRPHRWLRCLGIDSTLISADVSRDDVVALASKLQGGVFVTRDSKLALRREVTHAFVLTSQTPSDQLREICFKFKIGFKADKVLSRCVCGAKAFRKVNRGSVQGRVSPAVMEAVIEFFECGSCLQVFWMGLKSEKAIQNVKRILSEGQST